MPRPRISTLEAPRTVEREAALRAPVRNNYFYGKLLDADHLDLEQDYFVEARRLSNRLTVGAGVLCGLSATATSAGGVRISPGVAIDGLGREIVVTDPIVLDDPWALTDGCAEPTKERIENGPVLLCLAYHECAVDPTPVLVSDCDLREECVPGAIRERYRLLVLDPADGPPPPGDPCDTFRGKGTKVPTGNRELDELKRALNVMRARVSMEAYDIASQPERGSISEVEIKRPPVRDDMRTTLCERFKPSCAPGPACVPIALVSRLADEPLVVDSCGPRTTIYSNAVLLDLILCLAKRIEECCERKLTTDAPRITAVYPEPSQTRTLDEVATALELPGGGLSISFDQTMRDESLSEPAEWLRAIAFSDAERGGARPIELTFERVEGNNTAVYSFAPARAGGVGGRREMMLAEAEVSDEGEVVETPFLELMKKEGAKNVTVLVQIRSDDITQIASKAEEPVLLDADFRGTKLTGSELDLLWLAAPLIAVLPGGPSGLAQTMRLATPPSFPSGNLVDGGRLHCWFELTL